MGGSNSEIVLEPLNTNSTTTAGYNEEELAVFFANLELGITGLLSETSSSSSSCCCCRRYGKKNNNNGNDAFLVHPESSTSKLFNRLDDAQPPNFISHPPNSTSPPPPGSTTTTTGSYLNGFEQWNRQQAIHRQDDHHSRRFLQGETSNYNMEDLIDALLNSPDSFIAAALDERRTFVVQQLIRQVKNSPVATWVTLTLSKRCYQVMTHKIGKHVIKHCLLFLGNDPNQVLFEKAIEHYYELATHKEGCLSLNECINYISGPLREMLLLRIATDSAYLSHDPTGNFVVQHVLSLDNQDVNDKICTNLRGHYAQLSLNQRGSHVVEKCISRSILGMRYAVEEFLMKEKLLCQVARNEFGNYVIQMALDTTKVYASELYNSLVNALETNSSYIESSKFGRNVIYQVRGIVGNRRATMRFCG